MYQIIRIFCFLGLLLGICFTAQSSHKTYLCVKDTLIGISGENDVWTASKLTTTEDKFIIRPLKEGDYFYGDNENTHGVLIWESKNHKCLADLTTSTKKLWLVTVV
jgi:hypothetical protein